MTFTHTKYELTAPGRPAFKIASETVLNGDAIPMVSLKNSAETVIARMIDENNSQYKSFMVGVTVDDLDLYAVQEKPGRLGSSVYGKKVKIEG